MSMVHRSKGKLPPASTINAPSTITNRAQSGSPRFSALSCLDGGSAAGSDNGVSEMHPYDPHKAAKNVEVGDFYFKQGNYKAAISRYREALQWKPRDAVATYRLAEGLDKDGDLAEARIQYEAYLKILPTGEMATQAKAALERLNAQAVAQPK